MSEHAVSIQIDKDGHELGGDRYRWVCSCGIAPGVWKPRDLQARLGAARHKRTADVGMLRPHRTSLAYDDGWIWSCSCGARGDNLTSKRFAKAAARAHVSRSTIEQLGLAAVGATS